jgi:Uma2 family endonuclease
MATTTGLLSWEAFEKFPDDAMHHELIEGEHQVLPPPKSRHTRIARRISRAMQPLEDHGLGEVYLEGGYKLSADPATWVQPDVSFLRIERVQETSGAGYFTGGPEIAVEVVSPSETARDLDRKVELLLRSGTLVVWVIYPETRKVLVHSSDGTVLTRGINDTLTLPALLPDWQLPVAKLFEE